MHLAPKCSYFTSQISRPCKFLHIRYIQYIQGEQFQFLSFCISTIIEYALIYYMPLKFPVHSLNQLCVVLSVVKILHSPGI